MESDASPDARDTAILAGAPTLEPGGSPCSLARAARARRQVAKRSAGLLPFRLAPEGLEVLLVHPGGPLWARRDEGAWSLPKGEIEPGEEPLAAALREVEEETGFRLEGPYLPLGELRQRGGKRVVAWAVASDVDPAALRPGVFPLEWPPRSGRTREFPEVDRAAWFALPEARRRILASQQPFLDALERLVADERAS